jgi:hypothetical protein
MTKSKLTYSEAVQGAALASGIPANDFDAFELEEAARRASSFDLEAFRQKSKTEQAKHDVGIGVETEPQADDEDDEDQGED